jgi:hypothetical protein
MNKKLMIGGEVADTPYNLRTTEFILYEFMKEATRRGISANVLINKTLLPMASRYYNRNKSSKNK